MTDDLIPVTVMLTEEEVRARKHVPLLRGNTPLDDKLNAACAAVTLPEPWVDRGRVVTIPDAERLRDFAAVVWADGRVDMSTQLKEIAGRMEDA